MTVSPDLLLQAYRNGIFPMSESRDDPDIFWVDPRRRGIFPLDGFHVSRSLGRRLIRPDYNVTIDMDFTGVIDACADRPETWINPEIRELYTTLFSLGHAHSLEIWQDGRLSGGVYGVTVGAAFCGESMFSRRTDASKLALTWLVDHLRRTGFCLFDTQFLTPHLASLGAIEITRSKYHQLLQQASEKTADFCGVSLETSAQEVWQRMAQTS
ncbi:leucyl/phenylalanyl-tRNA--protein transferase [Puniceibacterium sediminis]|uniref:Leucyl/phenylalanyl-tRNA--protein transferase n=1 Tax=Puniceibacterium sediminis TaxID=1608407 RepID=A0A238V075_9RHOB|nr:leucyl/phenylalanyl-tRNA--protein transferase [Puniceibacterium sediminis]SNR27845.1 leucyl/phenylalanyl-tRNA--protein transferase [Puniceibacterium sediminis]